jgi:LPS-assembly protein
MLRVCLIAAVCLCSSLLPRTVFAQDELSSNCKLQSRLDSERYERLEDNSRFYGTLEQPAHIVCDDLQFFADYAEIFKKNDLVTARGHVVFVSGTNRIAADRMEFNTKTRTGTFYNAHGTAIIGENQSSNRTMFGGKEPYAEFWGKELAKVGPKRYRITNGGFTTCNQPTPRWEISSGTMTLNVDDYALLKNAVFRVKGVPLMYLPAFYYPIQEDDRATGFLIPTYGGSTIKGQLISNAFFWAIGRSHDATIYHDWMSKAGQQVGSEYRYVVAPGSQGNGRFSLLNEKPVTTTINGVQTTTPRERTFTLGGDFTQRLPGTFSLRGNADYFSSIRTQVYQQDINRLTNSNRRMGTNLSGTLGQVQVSATADRTDFFSTATTLTTYGSMPRVSVSRSERPVGRTPIYVGISGEYVTLLRSTTINEVKDPQRDQGLTRMDVTPTVRVPFNRLPFLGVNSFVAWHGTHWTESLSGSTQVNEGISRQYFDFNTRITGPVFNKIFNPPQGQDGLKYKHVIEPSLSIQKTTNIDIFDRIVKLESGDFAIETLRYTYGLTNRLYAKKDVAREVLAVIISQSYHTNKNASQYDRQYQSSFTARQPSNFTPVALHVRSSPAERIQAEFRTEWDPTQHALTTMSASGTFSQGAWLDGSAGWSQRRFPQALPGVNDPNRMDQYINANVNLRGFRNRIGGTYTFNYDLQRDRFLNQRWVAYYSAQCCGVGFEYQSFNLTGSLLGLAVPQDRRFNISFTLAGIGTFSNLFGAFGGQQGR